MIEPRKMPDETKEQINDKVKCFLVENFELKSRIKVAEEEIVGCQSQLDINAHHVKGLLEKFSGFIEKEHPEWSKENKNV